MNSRLKRGISQTEIDDAIKYAESPASGPGDGRSLADVANALLDAHPPRHPPEMSYAGYSGTDFNGLPNFEQAMAFAHDSRGRYGLIGDTPWGRFIDGGMDDPDLEISKDRFAAYLNRSDIAPHSGMESAMKDSLWNTGSAEYARNAAISKRPIVAFVENAPSGRGFASHELPVVIAHNQA